VTAALVPDAPLLAPAPPPLPPKSRLRAVDLVGTGGHGLRARKARTLLTALGIAIGIASMVAVLGISASSRADLLAQLDRLGTNLLQVQPGQDIFGGGATLPDEASAMLGRIGPVQGVSATTSTGKTVRRTDLIPEVETGGLAVVAAETDLDETLQASLAAGRFLDAASDGLPGVVLGAIAAERLGITSLEGSPRVWIEGTWFTVIGILDPVELTPEVDRWAIVGYDVAERLWETERAASTIYLRTDPDDVDSVRDVVPATANPFAPNEVNVSRPSDALEARAEADDALTALLLGLGAVALVVGGVGIANVMVISVLERRGEIGVRRALGATRRHVRGQFVVESSMLALIGGIGGVLLGSAVTVVYADQRGWTVDVPLAGLGGGIGAALLIGAVAGLYPAARAARLDPAEAVRPAG
jgi:putative ABC transport system permease protein